jgi:23S rRNA pseudouridine2605 synthase
MQRDRNEKGKPKANRKFKPRRNPPKSKLESKHNTSAANSDGLVRLNKFVANAGIASRREADELIKSGLVEVNGKIVSEMGLKVKPTDIVKFGGSIIRSEKKVYLLLNKPKGFITTVDDPKARKTVMELVANAGKERIYPVGRLDRKTTGVLMFTNDGDLAKKLTHPSHGASKIYDVSLDKNLTKADLAKIQDGLTLQDGPIQVDEISIVDGKNRKNVGVKIHSGRNRIVRRIFESLGYEVTKLDRVYFAGLTKKTLNRGQWRHLSAKEVDLLKSR